MQREQLKQITHWVIKLGSNVLLDAHGGLDRVAFVSLVKEINTLIDEGCEVTVVSSGAVALGRARLGHPPDLKRDIPTLQALAALGQPHLLKLYEEEFGHYGRHTAQMLLTRSDLDNRARYVNARRALERVRSLGAVPIINENDTVATEELRFGDNDQLAAMACGVEGAQVLVILSDVDGIFEVEHRTDGARHFTSRISHMDADAARLDEIAGPSISGVGTGGMMTKVKAARIAARFGVSTVVAPGKRVGVLGAIRRGEDVGTLLMAGERDGEAFKGRKVWLSAGAVPVGEVWCDVGAELAMRERGASLLPRGITRVDGEFHEGDVIACVSTSGERFAVGLAVYGADAMRELVGAHTEEIEARLGYHVLDCVMHRDNMVLT
jgi:glutamate 5-kinase